MHQMALPNWIKEIRSHALWDAIKWIWPFMAPLLYAALRAFRIAPDVANVFSASAAIGIITWLIASRRKEPRGASAPREAAEPAWASLDKFLRRTVEVREVRLSPGEFQDVVSAYGIHSLRIEVKEIESAKALIGIGGRSILYCGRDVQETSPFSDLFWIPRRNEVGEGYQGVFYWNISPETPAAPGYFSFWCLWIEHINPHAKEVLFNIAFVYTNPNLR